MFDFLKLKNNRFIGVDLGTSYIKVVELSYSNQRINLENYAWVDLSSVPEINDSKKDVDGQVSHDDKIKHYLKVALDKMGIDSGKVFISIPAFNGLMALLDFPEMKEEEVSGAVEFEARKYIPTSLDEVVLTWEVMQKPRLSEGKKKIVLSGEDIKKKETEEGLAEKKSERMQIMLVAATKKNIQRYQSIFGDLGLDISVMELETFSLVRSLVGDDNGTYLIIDIGSRATNIILVNQGVIYANRNINTGGNEITNTMAESLNISRMRAEGLKKEKKDLVNSREAAIVFPTLEMTNNEARRIIAAYNEKNKDGKIEGIILSGGSAKMEGLDRYFTRSLGIKVSLGNPWKRVYYEDAARDLVIEMGSSFAVAIGLAMRGIEDYKRS